MRSLAERVLCVDPFLKPKYTYSGILADHVSVGTMLQVCPSLPLEIMDAMNYQSLAPHVSHTHASCTHSTVPVIPPLCTILHSTVSSPRLHATTHTQAPTNPHHCYCSATIEMLWLLYSQPLNLTLTLTSLSSSLTPTSLFLIISPSSTSSLASPPPPLPRQVHCG